MEYLVIRDLSLSDREFWNERFLTRKIGDKGNLTFSRTGGFVTSFPFKMGDIFWGAVKQKGVFTKGRITERHDFQKITSHSEIDEIKNITLPSLRNDEKYWKKEHNKLDDVVGNVKPWIHLILLDTEVIEVIENPFPIEQNSPQSGYVSLDNNLNRDKYFELIGRKAILTLINYNDEKYLTIDYKVSQDLIHLFGENKIFNGDLLDNSKIDKDHFIPQSIGGPGAIVQNILPVPFSWNRSKSAYIPIALILVAQKYLNFPEKTLEGIKWKKFNNGWDSVIEKWNKKEKDGVLKHEIKLIALAITKKIKGMEELVQRRFYYEVLREGLLYNVKEVYPKCKENSFDIGSKYLLARNNDINNRIKHIHSVLEIELQKLNGDIVIKK